MSQSVTSAQVKRLLVAIAIAAASTSLSHGAELVVLGGQKIQGSGQGDARFAAAGVAFDEALSRVVEARLEVYPAELYRERSRPEREGPAGQTTVLASAACLLARFRLSGTARSSFFAEAGAGPFYAYVRPVPSGGTRGNFFDQIGIGLKHGRLSYLLRFAHVSNANVGPQRHRGNPGLSFATAGLSWSLR